MLMIITLPSERLRVTACYEPDFQVTDTLTETEDIHKVISKDMTTS